MNQPSPEDIAAMRKQGDLGGYLRAVIASTAKPTPAPKPAPLAAAADPGYRITHTGGWPIGTAATGPTPTDDRCTCAKCRQATVTALPAQHGHEDAA